MGLRNVLGLLAVSLLVSRLSADDWPVFQQNNQRNAKTAERLSVDRLVPDWTWRSVAAPEPAWSGASRWDAYDGLRGLKSMRNYDPVFHPIAVGDRIWLGSSVDDAVHCLDARTGRSLWVYCSDGPVRAAPTYWQGKLYFGSDDGYAYCLTAAGQLVWKVQAHPCERKIVSNGRFISTWPVRTGVLIEEDRAIFGASLLPWQESYLCAVDARAGTTDSAACFVRRVDEATLEGPMGVFPGRALVCPQGRIPPQLFTLRDGRPLGSLQGGGGSFVLLTKDSVFHGPGNKTGWLTASSLDTLETVASYKDGNAMVVAGDTSFILTDKTLTAANYVTQQVVWTADCDCPLALIMAGDVLLAGGQDRVAAFDARDGRRLWSQSVDGKAYGLAVAQGRLLVSTDTGALHAFKVDEPATPPVAAASQAAAMPAVPTVPDAVVPDGVVSDEKPRVAVGPWWRFTARDTAVVRWRTRTPSPTRLTHFCDGRVVNRIDEEPARLEHEVVLRDLKHDVQSGIQLEFLDQGQWKKTAIYECDTCMNFSLPARLPVDSGLAEESRQLARAATALVFRGGSDGSGLCLCLGSHEGEWILDLVQNSSLRVVVFDTDAPRVQTLRRRLQQWGIYGQRATAHLVDSLDRLPITGRAANVIVSESLLAGGECPVTPAEVRRLLAPGGVAWIGSLHSGVALPEAWRPNEAADLQPGRWAQLHGTPIEGAGAWTHIYGTAANNHYGEEALAGARTSQDLVVQWIGRPGASYQADRNGRKPPPLSVGGRIFLQGLHRLLALDQYNGTVLWSLELPEMDRYNMPRDCGNWCADERAVYVAIRDKCWKLAAVDGSVVKLLDVESPDTADARFDWGYIAREKDLLIGSAVRAGTSWTGFWGKEAWYDGAEGPVADKVCSDRLFARGADFGELRWQYGQGAIVNSTITIGSGTIFFVDARGDFLDTSPSRRLGGDTFWQNQYLVALDAASGQLKWERPLDTEDGTVALYAAYGDGKLVLVSSTKRQYFVYAYAADSGTDLWQGSIPWGKGKADHGSHLSRPAIVGQRLYVRPGVFELESGKALALQIPVGGCGTYAATQKALFFRAGSGQNSAMWDQESGEYTMWHRLRPDCWLSTIPAGGMLLSPEGGGGCSCGSWLETSVGFIPQRSLTP